MSIGIDVTPLPELIDFIGADTALSAIATGGAWEDPSPDHVDDLVVIVGLQASHDETLCMTDRLSELFVIVKAVGPAAQIADVRAAGKRIDDMMIDRLVGQPIGDYVVMLCQRSEAVSYNDPEPTTGIRYEHRGGIYRLLVSTR